MEPDSKNKNVAVETYSGDIAEAIQNDQGGLVKKIIHEEEARENEKRNLSPESKQNKFLAAASALLVALGLGILIYFLAGSGTETVEVGPEFVPLVFADQSSFVETAGLKKSEIIYSVFNQVRGSSVRPGGIKGIYLTADKKIMGLRQFLSLLGSNFNPGENPAIISDNFALGAVKHSEAPGFFILLKTRTIEDIFEPMRLWEAKMFYDLHEFLGLTLDSGNKYLLTKSFEDGVVENKNARFLHDNAGNLVLMYVFADNNSVVLADSQAAAREVMLRLAAKQIKE